MIKFTIALAPCIQGQVRHGSFRNIVEGGDSDLANYLDATERIPIIVGSQLFFQRALAFILNASNSEENFFISGHSVSSLTAIWRRRAAF